MKLWGILVSFGLLLAGCGSPTEKVSDVASQTITLSSGRQIVAEVMILEKDMMRGMQFRDAMPPDRGMLFVHRRPGRYTYWMHQVKVPLDIIWLDRDKRVVEISANTPPCTAKEATGCPTYGGHAVARFVLELNGGLAQQYDIRVGTPLSF